MFKRSPLILDGDIEAIESVFRKGTLSGFRGAPGEQFLGGEKVREFEAAFASYFGVKYAVTLNSCTSALHVACAACGIGTGDEVIVTPFTFTASAKCALYLNAVPVFADITDDIFCIDPKEIERKITPKTKAIIPVHLFGHPAPMDRIMEIARKYNLKVIEDSAQSLGGVYKGQYAGTIGDCGVFSFDSAKAITSLGEGGMLITNDDAIAYKAQAMRNHGEMLESNILGYNFRMTEAQAAMGLNQFKRLDEFNDMRIGLCNYLTDRLKEIENVIPPIVYSNCEHVYFCYAVKVPHRDTVVDLLNKNGIYMGKGYNRPLHLLPIFGGKEGDCPVAERMYRELMVTDICKYPATLKDMDFIADTLEKILRELNL